MSSEQTEHFVDLDSPPLDDEQAMAQLKLPPHSVEAEQAVLGGLLLKASDVWDTVAEQIQPTDFYRGAHRDIYKRMQLLVEQGKEIDILTIADDLQNAGQLDAIGGLPYLTDLVNITPSVANIGAYASVVRERATLRKLIEVAHEISESSYRPEGKSADELLADAERHIMKIGESQPKEGGPQDIKPILKKTIDRIDELFNSEGSITGVTTGFTDLDEMTSGLQKTDLVILAARPSMGKTTLAMNLVENAIMAQDKPALVFSMEMPADALAMRMLSSLGRINQTKVRNGQLDEEDWPKLSAAVNKLRNTNLHIDDSSALSPADIRSRARRIVREHGDLSMIMIDYLQLMKIKGASEGRTAEISEISRSLKAIAKEFDCPVIALSQLNRSLEQRPNKRPVNSDLRESGAIEQDADLIMFIYRDEVYNEDTQEKGVAEIIIGKQRNGPIGTCKLAFIGQYTRFENLTRGYDEEY